MWFFSHIEDHNDFLQNLFERDQTFRNVKSSKINDLDNIISASYYLNRFGCPSAEEIKFSYEDVMNLAWTHSYIKVKQVSFPIILAGYKSGQISEKDIKLYYLVHFHWRRYHNQDFRTKNLDTMIADHDMRIEDKIYINNILRAYNESEEFRHQNYETIEHWNDPKDSTVKILKNEDGKYYFHKRYGDGSYYPQEIIRDEHYPNLFRNYYKPELYFAIQPKGDLTVKSLTIKNKFIKRTFKPADFFKGYMKNI